MDFYGSARQLHKRPDSILFVTSQLRQREIKMAQALRSQGLTVNLLYYKSTPFKPDGFFDFFWEVTSPKMAYQYAEFLEPKVIHVFSGAIDDYVLSFCKKKIAPVVIDLNDIFSPALMDYCPERYSTTRKALALADGFSARDLQIKTVEKLDQLNIPSNLIFFPEYCWNTQVITKPKKENDDIHLVSVGTISLETYNMYDCCYLQLIRMILEHDIHFHIYPPWSYRKDFLPEATKNFERDYRDFIQLAHKNPYLHIHDSVPADKLIEVLPQYDFGVISGGFTGFGQRYTHFKPAYVESCYSGRIADYLDAHLPVLINEEVVFDAWLLKRYGVFADLKGVLQPQFKLKLQNLVKDQAMQKQVAAAKSTLSILKNAPRLANFYSKIMKTKPSVIERTSVIKRLSRMIGVFGDR